jgi:membrane fusion protein, multidrug efflux system
MDIRLNFKSLFIGTIAFLMSGTSASALEEEALLAQLSFASENQTYRVVLAPRSSATLSSGVTSVVKSIPKELGQSFEKGDVLVLLDDTVFLADQLKTQSILERSEAQLSAKQELFKDDVASLLELKDAEAQVASSQAEVALAKQRLESCRITAPYSGRISNVFMSSHEMVQAGQELVKIVDDRMLLAKMLVPSNEYKGLNLGQSISIHVHETEVSVSGKISHIGASIDPASSMIKVYAEVINNQDVLRSGMIGTTSISSQETVL